MLSGESFFTKMHPLPPRQGARAPGQPAWDPGDEALACALTPGNCSIAPFLASGGCASLPLLPKPGAINKHGRVNLSPPREAALPPGNPCAASPGAGLRDAGGVGDRGVRGGVGSRAEPWRRSRVGAAA